jgi:hypothetical protein
VASLTSLSFRRSDTDLGGIGGYGQDPDEADESERHRGSSGGLQARRHKCKSNKRPLETAKNLAAKDETINFDFNNRTKPTQVFFDPALTHVTFALRVYKAEGHIVWTLGHWG